MTPQATPVERPWSASDLRKATPAERDAVLCEAAARAEHQYRTDSELTAFEAFGKEDLHGESSAAPTG